MGQFMPQVLQAWVLQALQDGALCAMARPSEWAKNRDSLREECMESQSGHAIGLSASLIERRASNCDRQSRQAYS
jgi:hypothetical protein